MDEDPEISEFQADAQEDKDESPQMSAGAAVAILLAALLVVGFTIYFGVAQTVAGLVIVLGIPVALVWFVWSLFLRRLWRMRRIRGAREKRELLEATLRRKKTDQEGR